MTLHSYLLSDTVYVISDIHLVSDRDKTTKKLVDWLQQYGSSASAIYIIGDLFDYWVGDRCIQRFPVFFEALSQLTRQCPVYFMPGNRDFLVSRSLLNRYGIDKITDPTTIHHGGQNYLLTHGDLLCSADKAYQWLRFFLQNRVTLALAYWLPYAVKHTIATNLRSRSRRITRSKSSSMMSACDTTTLLLAQKHRVSNLIHGHVHCLEQKNVDATAPTSVFVLDSWEHQINHCVIGPHGVQLASE